jgi:hypothetical protein
MAAVTAVAAAAAPIAGERVFAACLMAGATYVAMSIPRFVAVEVVVRVFAAPRHRSMVAVVRVIPVVDVTPETARAVKPRASPQKHAASEPVGPVVAVGGTVIRSIVEISIGADRRAPYIDAN